MPGIVGTPVELEIITRIGNPGEGEPIEGIFAGIFKDNGQAPIVKQH